MDESTEIVPFEDSQLEQLGAGLPVTQDDLDDIRGRITLLKKFVQKQLVKDVDYGYIYSGAKEMSLYQPGAQKFARLFRLTAKKECTYREVNRHENYAEFTYRCDIYHAPTGKLIAQCEGSCNSQEEKRRTRSKYVDKKYVGKEETPVCDILNTIQKMAQKRAFVGAVLEACNASDFFTSDIDTPADAKRLGLGGQDTTTVKSNIPKATKATSTDDTKVPPCPKCDGEMMVSRYDESKLYCKGCKAVIVR